MDTQNSFIQVVKRPFRFKMFLLKKLPAAYFSGLRVTAFDNTQCTVAIPFKWFTKNPFRSTYFACLSMAAELSTGALAMASVYGRTPAVSMLVTKIEAEFFKKAVGRSFFTCTDGEAIEKAVQAAVDTGEGQVFQAITNGVNEQQEPIARFVITWSFKVKLPGKG